MPTAPRRPCTYPRCPRYAARRGLCEEHERQRKRGVDMRRGTPSQRGYGSAWQQVRAAVLARDPDCTVPGCGEVSTDVDHVVPRARGGSDEPANLVGLCHPHHSAKTARGDRGFGNRGGGAKS